jgi:hypothetical protein
MASPTLLDIAKINGNDKVVGLIEENLKVSAAARIIPFRTVKGTSYTTGVRTGFPTAGFRAANDGQVATKSTFEKRIVECFIFGGNIEADVAVADAYEDGASAWQMIEAMGMVEAALRALSSQVFYGVTADAKGFAGLKAFTAFGTSTAYGDPLTVNAAGTTATTASSAYLVRYGVQNVNFVSGMNGAFNLPPFYKQMVSGNTGKFEAYVSALTSWIGLQIGNENAVRRICNLTADAGKGMTDSLLATSFGSFPDGLKPDAIFMSRRSRTQLQASRTVTLFGNGSVRPNQPLLAPIPTEYDGVPIQVDDAILNTDAIET